MAYFRCVGIGGQSEKLVCINEPYSDNSPVIYEEIIDKIVVDNITFSNENAVSPTGGASGVYKEVTKSKIELYIKTNASDNYVQVSNDDYILYCYKAVSNTYIYRIIYNTPNTYIYAVKIKFTDVYRVYSQLYYKVKSEAGENPDPNLIAYWDFIENQSSDLIDDKINHFIFKNSGFQYVTNGVYTQNTSSHGDLPCSLLEKNRAYEIEFGEIQGSSTTNLNRILSHRTDTNAAHGNSGFGWCTSGNGAWGVWDSTNQWQVSNITDINYFSNSILRIEIDSNGIWKIYKNGVLVYTTPLAVPLSPITVFQLGSSQYSLYTMTVKSLKIYKLS